MAEYLLLTVHLHEDGQGGARYHGRALGAPEWPPSPARVFQAMVAGNAIGNALPADLSSALEWLEALPPPLIASPRERRTKPYALFVPNNDADALPDPRDISEIRTKKTMQPVIVERNAPLLYAWSLESESGNAGKVIDAAERVYQLGRGTDMAWASGEIVDAAALESRYHATRNIIHRPQPGGRERLLACPIPGSLASLLERHRAPRLTHQGASRNARILFTNAPKPRFLNVSYERSREHLIYELRARENEARAWPWMLNHVVTLVEELRDAAAARLRTGLPTEQDVIDRVLIGRLSKASEPASPEHRVRIIPLPSIGHRHADRAVRRVVLDIPSGAELSVADIEWAFSGLEPTNKESGAARPFVLIRSDDRDMLRQHYTGPARRFRSVTPVALPEPHARRRIDPARRSVEPKKGTERALEDDRAIGAVHTALRHVGVRAIAVAVRVQREPFDANGTRVEPFSDGTRFAKERLWHIEIEFDRAVRGPLVLGDGRFLGLGVMAPVREAFAQLPETPVARLTPRQRRTAVNHSGLFAFHVQRHPKQDAVVLARALRRAVLARVQAELGSTPLDRFFSGHEPNGGKAETEHANHVAFQWDPIGARFLVIAPHWLERREPSWNERRSLHVLERALDEFTELRTHRDGVLELHAQPVDTRDPLIAPNRTWLSMAPYTVTRHAKRVMASQALSEDVIRECQRRALPRPEVAVINTRGVAGRGLEGSVRLEFAVAVGGPIILGRTRYLGGGLFAGAP